MGVSLAETSPPHEVLREAGIAVDFPSSEAKKDVEAILSGFSLQTMRRYFHQKHWRRETLRAVLADSVESRLKLESVAAHSWHVADCALLLAPQFPHLDLSKVTTAAILHDKLEMITGDFDPVGVDGQGTDTHAFADEAAASKVEAELRALERYIARINHRAGEYQRAAMLDIIFGHTEEARFVKAVDKLQALAFVLVKKEGAMTDSHLRFTVRYSARSVRYFPALSAHYAHMIELLTDAVRKHRKADRSRQIASWLNEALRA